MKNLTKLRTLVLLLSSFTVFNYSVFAYVLIPAEVTSIYDGDTIRVRMQGEEQLKSVRLKGIDTPEIEHNGESQGEAAIMARDFLREKLPIGSRVELKVLKNEVQARRLYAQVIYLGVDLNKELLKQGLAVTYVLAPFDDETLQAYSNALESAVENELGIYDGQFRNSQLAHNLLEPYLFRLQVEGKAGHYLIGDIKSKKLYSGEDIQEVAVYNRIFFHNLEIAEQAGFRF